MPYSIRIPQEDLATETEVYEWITHEYVADSFGYVDEEVTVELTRRHFDSIDKETILKNVKHMDSHQASHVAELREAEESMQRRGRAEIGMDFGGNTNG